MLKVQVPRTHDNNAEGISRIGLISNHNDVEFKPIKIWQSYESSQEIYQKIKYYDYYYPLSLIAFSGSTYDIYRGNDLSIFSKKVILVPDSFILDNSTMNRYLEYVREGGTLIAINSDNNFNGTFSRLFSIIPNENKTESFSNIVSHKYQNLDVRVPWHW